MTYCGNCGTAAVGGRFCAHCGSELTPAAQPDPPRSVEPEQAAVETNVPTPAPSPYSLTAPAPAPSLRGDGADHRSGRPNTRPPLPRTDLVRDGGTLVVLIAILVKPWSWMQTGGETVYVLLAVLCSIASIVPAHLQRVMTSSDGGLVRWPVRRLRLVLNAPLALVLVVELIRNLVAAGGGGGSGDTLAVGPGFYIAGFALALAATPRTADVVGDAEAPSVMRQWRKAAGWLSGVGLALVAIITLVPVANGGLSGSIGALLLLFLVLLGMVLYVALAVAIPVLRVGADHPAWQPVGLWLGAGIVFALVIGTSTLAGGSGLGSDTGWESVLLMIGVWLLISGCGLCVAPMVGGRDGSQESPAYWELVVANAFRFLVVTAGVVLAFMVLSLINGVQERSQIALSVVTLLIAAVFVVAASVASSRLRGMRPDSRHVALVCLGVMFADSIVLLIVSAIGSGGVGGSIGALILFLPLYFGPFGVIAFGLLAPKAIRAGGPAAVGDGVGLNYPTMRQQTAADSAGLVPAPSTPPIWTPPAAAMPGFHDPQPAPLEASTLGSAVAGRGLSAAGPAVTDASPFTSGPADDDAEKTILRKVRPPGGNAATAAAVAAHDPQTIAASDPLTPLGDLMTIAQSRPDLRPAVAANPSTYRRLLDWLAALNDPAVDAALARRQQPPAR